MARILIADPDGSFRKALILLLTHKLGIEGVEEAADIGQLIQVLVDKPPEVLLLSWSLYGAPGLETCQLLRKSYPTMKIMLLSVNPEDEAAAKSAGAQFIHKGSSAEATLSALKSLFAMEE